MKLKVGQWRPYLSMDRNQIRVCTTRPLGEQLGQVSKISDQWFRKRCDEKKFMDGRRTVSVWVKLYRIGRAENAYPQLMFLFTNKKATSVWSSEVTQWCYKNFWRKQKSSKSYNWNAWKYHFFFTFHWWKYHFLKYAYYFINILLFSTNLYIIKCWYMIPDSIPGFIYFSKHCLIHRTACYYIAINIK